LYSLFSDFRKGGNNGSLVEYCAQVIDRGEKGLLDVTAGTLRNYKASLRRLREYVRDTQVGDVQFGDIDMDFHRKFSTYLSEYANLHYESIKTKMEATLPVKQSALDLMERYHYDFSFSSNVQANRELKTIAAMAGLNTHASEDDRSGPKSMFVTTHTARRSAATNLYLEGVSLKMIADLGGWKDLQSLRTYLRASGLDTAQVAGDLDFFN
jgi:integrase